MAEQLIDQELLSLLRSVDTPTVCNAIEVVQGRHGFKGFTRSTVLAANPTLPSIVGFARTAKIAGASPPVEKADVIRSRQLAYYQSMTTGELPTVAVIEDLDYPNCVGAFWGEVNTTVHAGLGVGGALTNGVMRDLDDLASGFQGIAGSIGPSHGFVHIVEIDFPVSVFGLLVRPSDLVHADRHGAIVIPTETISSLADAIAKMRAAEALILDPAREIDFTFEKLWLLGRHSRAPEFEFLLTTEGCTCGGKKSSRGEAQKKTAFKSAHRLLSSGTAGPVPPNQTSDGLDNSRRAGDRGGSNRFSSRCRSQAVCSKVLTMSG